MNIHSIIITILGVSSGHPCMHVRGAHSNHFFFLRNGSFVRKYTDDPEIVGEGIFPLANVNDDLRDIVEGLDGGTFRVLPQFVTVEQHAADLQHLADEKAAKEADDKNRQALLDEAAKHEAAAQELRDREARGELGGESPDDDASGSGGDNDTATGSSSSEAPTPDPVKGKGKKSRLPTV
jgi:hypothetical protein